MQWVRRIDSLNEEAAWKMIAAARGSALSQGIAVNVAVMDAGANLLAFSRMDGAPLLSEEISRNKAYTAVAFGRPTGEWYPMVAQDPALLHGIVHTPRLVIFAGGLPVRVGEQVVGGIGVSGGTSDQDEICAKAAIQAISGPDMN